MKNTKHFPYRKGSVNQAGIMVEYMLKFINEFELGYKQEAGYRSLLPSNNKILREGCIVLAVANELKHVEILMVNIYV